MKRTHSKNIPLAGAVQDALAGRGTAIPWYWIIIAVGLSIAFSANKLSDSDTWWHLAGGRLILQGEFPRTNTFSYTYPDYPWAFTQWLFATLLALGEKLGGLYGVQLVQIIFGAATFLTMAASASLLRKRFDWRVFFPIFLIALSAARIRILARGELASLVGLSLLQYLWLRRPRHLPILCGILGVVWVNLHAGAVFGLLFLVLASLSSLITGDKKLFRISNMCIAAFFFGTLCNPYFLYPYRYILDNLIFTQGSANISELLPPTYSQFPAFYLYAALGIVSMIHSLMKRRILPVFLFSMFLAMAFFSNRFIPYFLILSFPGMYLSLSELLDELSLRISSRKFEAAIIVALLSISILSATQQYRRWPFYKTGLGGDLGWFPQGACDYIEARGLTGRLFNEFGDGGYLEWRLFPKHRVFIDGRGMAYPLDHVKAMLRWTAAQVAALLNEFQADVAIIRRGDIGVQDPGFIFDFVGWQLVFLDDRHYVFVRPGSSDAIRTTNDVLTVIKPWLSRETLFSIARKFPLQTRAELSKISFNILHDGRDFSILGTMAYYGGDPDMALRIFLKGLDNEPDDAVIRVNVAKILARAGRFEEAKNHFLRVIRDASDPALGAEARQEMEQLHNLRQD